MRHGTWDPVSHSEDYAFGKFCCDPLGEDPVRDLGAFFFGRGSEASTLSGSELSDLRGCDSCVISLDALLSPGGSVSDIAKDSDEDVDSCVANLFHDSADEADSPDQPWKVNVPASRMCSQPVLPRALEGPGQREPAEQTTARSVVPPGLSCERTLVSLGSAEHGSGNCKPCGFFWKAGGCRNGQLCCHCHLCPEGAVRQRRKAKYLARRFDVKS